MRHALITTHLLHEARTAATTEAAERQSRSPLAESLAEEETEVRERGSRRLSALARRARALVVRTT